VSDCLSSANHEEQTQGIRGLGEVRDGEGWNHDKGFIVAHRALRTHALGSLDGLSEVERGRYHGLSDTERRTEWVLPTQAVKPSSAATRQTRQ